MSSRLKVLLGVVLVVVVALGAGVYWFLRDDSPDEVSLEAAVESVRAGATTTAGGGAGGSDDVEGVEGTWTVDADSGEFDYDSATGTFVGFRIGEELAGIGAAEAVGRTGDVTGSITIDGTTLTAATFKADVTTITTNDSRRDDRVQQALETDEFPTATFELTEPVDLGAAAAEGGSVAVTATGELTVHGTTQAVEIPLEAQLVQGTVVVVVGSLPITFADYGVEVPSSPAVVSADDHGIVELQVLLTRG